MSTLFRTGDAVRITFAGRTTEGHVQLASSNGRSLMLAFDEILGGYCGAMPVLQAEGDEEYRDLITSEVVRVEAGDT